MPTSTGAGSPYRKTVTTRGVKYFFWACQVNINGRRKTLTAKTRAEVVALRNGLVAPPRVLRAQSQTLGQYLAKWTETVKPSVANNTWRQWESHTRKHLIPKLGGIPIRDLTALDIDDYLNRTDLGAQTLNHHRSTLRVALEAARIQGLVVTNVAKDARARKMPAKDKIILDPPQLRILIDGTICDRLGALWAVIGTTGVRISEALGLQWDDIDFESGMLHVRNALDRVDGEWVLHRPKTPKSRRSIPLGDATVSALRRHRLAQIEQRIAAGHPGTDGLVFTGTRGQPINASNIAAVLHSACARLDLPEVTVHSIRHTVATTLMAQGVPIGMVAAWLGHSSSRVTEVVYGHVGGEDLRAGADVMEAMVR